MKILVVSPNQEKFPTPILPIGAAYIISALETEGHVAKLADLCFEDDPHQKLESEIKHLKPEIICISVRNIDNESMFSSKNYLDFIKSVVKICKKSGAKIIVGGAAFSLMPQKIFKLLDSDFGVIGDGEDALNELISNIDNHDYIKTKNYFITNNDNEDKEYMPHKSKKGFKTLFPQRSQYLKNYFEWSSFAIHPKESVQTKRGCCFSCAYCPSPVIEGKGFRLREIKHVIEEIATLATNGVKSLFFVDNVFNFPRNYAEELCHKIIENNINIQWMCYLSPLNVDENFAKLIKKAGCLSVHFGTDHLCNEMLGQLNKGFELADVLEAEKSCKQAGLMTIHSFIFGGYGETNATIQRCLNCLDQLQPGVTLISMGLRLYAKTALSKKAIELGQLDKDDELVAPKFFLSPSLNLQEACSDINSYMETNKGKLIRCSFPVKDLVKDQEAVVNA